MGWLPMTYSVKHARSGLTAIAAVLALSSTPLLAQEVTETPPDPVAETTAADPAPEAPAPEPTATDTTAESAPAETAAPATTTRRAATASRTTTTTTRRASSQPAVTAAPAAAAPATEATAQPMPLPPPTGAMVDPGAMPVDETAVETTAAPADDALPIAAAAGLGLLALGGMGMAIGRRRQRRDELAHQKANRDYLASHPDTPESHAPADAFSSIATPALAGSGPGQPLTGAPRTKLPPNYLSRFGPHVRAAYLGPTEDNPSLSMKHRLRRAAAMDQQARQHGEAPREATIAARRDDANVTVRPNQAKKPLWNSANEGFMLRPAGSRQTSKTAYQH